MSTTYRPGQLYTGRDGDRLFVVAVPAGIRFVTNRATPLEVEHVERVYAPLTLISAVGGQTTSPTPGSDVTEMAAAIREALDLPNPAGDWGAHNRIAMRRAAFVVGVLERLAEGDESATSTTIRAVRGAVTSVPVDYAVRDEQGGGSR